VSLRVLLPVRLVDRRLTAILFLHGFFAVGAFVAGRSARDALFLSHLGGGPLAWMYIASAVAVALFGLTYSALVADFRPQRAILISSILFALLVAAAWAAEPSGQPWVYATLYVLVEVMGAISVTQFWTMANELFNPREARRWYALIGAGGTISNVVIGLATIEVARAFGARAVLLLCAALMFGCGISALFAGSAGKHRLVARSAAKGRTTRAPHALPKILTSGHLRLVAALTVVTFMAVTIVDFEFKVAAIGSHRADSLAIYFGYFYVVVGLLAVALQVFGSGKLLARIGVIGALAILPLALGAGNLLIALVQKLWAATIAKGADTLFRYSINDATTQMLYLPVPAQWRASSKAFIDGVVKHFAIGLAGMVLLAYRHWSPANSFRIALPTVALCAIWVAIVLGLRSRYVQSLRESLQKRRLDVEFAGYGVQDGSTSKVLMQALKSEDTRQVLNSLELLPRLRDIHLDDRVEILLEHVSPTIRTAALDYYARRPRIRYANTVFRMLDDRDPAVRAAAIATFCVLGRDKSVGSIKSFLTDSDPRIRSAAVTGMIRYGGLDGVISAADALKKLIAHPEASMRKHAAQVLRDIGVSNFYQPVLQLMGDRDPSVRREAIAAAGALRSTDLLVPLIRRTAQPETGREAIEALTAYGPSIAPTLASFLDNLLEDPRARRGAARVLGQLASPEAIRIMLRNLDEPDEELRAVVYRSLARMTHAYPVERDERKRVHQALDRELLSAYRCLSDAQVLDLRPRTERPSSDRAAAETLLSSALAEKVGQAQRRIFLLLAVLFPDAQIESIEADTRDEMAINSRRRRANVVELMDNVLDRELNRRLLPLIEDIPRAEKLALVAKIVPLPAGTRDETLAALCQCETAWVRACALNYAAYLDSPAAAKAAPEMMRDPSPIVREVALLCLARMTPGHARAVALASLHDESPSVRRQAALIAAQRAAS
jgi:AAA family ATP:ADP antiporter